MKCFFNEVSKHAHKLTNKGKRLGFSLLLLKLLSIGSPAEANNNKITDSNLAKIELEKHNTVRVDENLGYTPLLTDLLKSSPDEANNKTTNIIGNIEKDTGIKFPASYRERFCDFLYNHPTMQHDFVREYTENFIRKKLSEDWGIDKSNQLLFICSAIENKVSGESLYKNHEENDQKRKEDFKKIAILVLRAGKAYATGLLELANNISEESKAKFDELYKENNKLREENKKLVKDGLKELMESYKEYKNNPRDEVLKELRASAKRRLIPGCRENGINPHDFLTPEACKDLGF